MFLSAPLLLSLVLLFPTAFTLTDGSSSSNNNVVECNGKSRPQNIGEERETFKEKVIRERKEKRRLENTQHEEVQRTLDTILKHCGEVCNTEKTGTSPGGNKKNNYYDVIKKLSLIHI